MTTCLWCNGPEPCQHYRPLSNVDFVCSRCTQLLLGCSQDMLQELQTQCGIKGYDRKVEALESFIGEEEYVPETTKIRRSMVRKRSVRPVRPTSYEIRA